MPISITKGLEEKCHDCGIALYKIEIDGEIRGEFVDYGRHEQGMINLTLCSGCWDRLRENMKKEQGDAILKRAELDNIPKKDHPLDYSGAIDEYLNDNPQGPDLPDGTGAGI